MSRQPRQTAAFSLFTFLDVMLCTLGALIIVLICVVRTAQIKNADAAPKDAEEIEEIESARKTAEWGAKQLAAARDKTRQQLQDRRLELSHIEDHSRRLRAQIAEMEAAAAPGDAQQQEKLAALRHEAQRLAAAAANAEEELQRARTEAGTKRASYAIVPYEGPNGTSRRPLYIECRADAILLQPEGIVLTGDDLGGPLGPGNPLAAGLRAAREYLSQGYSFDEADGGEPYPLLLVRPNGVTAYYVVREAMMSWGAEFGYEFIDQEWKLEFRPPPPGMVDAIQAAVAEARIRQRTLARAAPRYYAENQREWYRASSSGGVVRDGGPSGSGGRRSYQRAGRSGDGGGEYAQSGGGRYGRGGTHAVGGYGGDAAGGRGAGGDYPTSGTQAESAEDLTAIYGAVASAPAGSAGSTGRGTGKVAGGGTGSGGTGSGAGAGGGAGLAPYNNAPAGGAAGGTPGGALARGAGPNGTGANGSGAVGAGATVNAAPAGASPYFVGTAYGNAAGAPGGNTGGLGGAPQNGAGNNALAGGMAGGNLAGTAGNSDGPLLTTADGTQSTTPAGVAVNANGAAQSGSAAGGAGYGAGANSSPDPATGAGNQTASSANETAAAKPGTGGPGQIPTDFNGATGNTDLTAAGASNAQGKTAPGQAGGGRAGSGQQAGGGAQAGGAQSGSAGSKAPNATANSKPGSRCAMTGASSGSGAGTPAGTTPLNIGDNSSQTSATNDPTNQSLQVGAPSINISGARSATNSMADRRGKNWSLPEDARHAVPLTRPVRVECRADKLVLRSERVPSQSREIAMSEYTETSVEDLVAAVWQHVDTWGPPGHGMYWRPVLSVDVAPGAEGRFADLQTLLADSGLDVKAAAKPAPPVARPQRKLGLW